MYHMQPDRLVVVIADTDLRQNSSSEHLLLQPDSCDADANHYPGSVFYNEHGL